MKGLAGKGRPKPYFVGIWVQQQEEQFVEAVSGAVVQEHPEDHPRRYGHVEVRLGSYASDSSNLFADGSGNEHPDDDWGWDPSKLCRIPIEDDPASIRSALWLMADVAYKRALRDYQAKSADGGPREANLKDFSREGPVVAVKPIEPVNMDFDVWREIARQATRQIARDPEIFSPSCWVQANRTINYLVNTEGTVLRTSSVTYTVSLQATARAADGEPVDAYRFHFVTDPSELPDEQAFIQEARGLAKELTLLRKVPSLSPYTGPAILDPGVAGVLFHEALGHRLEGERQRDPRSGQTFKGKIGQSILPAFISVTDDPSRRWVDGKTLVGHYEFDSQGVQARPTRLVENGVLRNYILSRTPVTGFDRSNGHGRAESPYQVFVHYPFGPRARMGVLEVTATRRHAAPDLKRMLLDEVRRQGKPFGLILRHAQGGDTDTYGGNYQAYRTTPGLVYRVDAKTGRETLVRGVEMVGTPLVSLEKILAVGDEPVAEQVWNASCGAETGWVPVSTICPSVLTAQVELQRIATRPERPPELPSPYSEDE